MKAILYISSITVILFSGLYLYQENMAPEWRRHQVAYLDQIEAKQQSDSKQKVTAYSFDIGLKQIWLPQMNRADRCISCHLALEDPTFMNAANPLRTHPEDYLQKHDAQTYGCTICHDGQGRAITWKAAAADTPDCSWDKPLLRKPFIQANCYRCHTDDLDQTPDFNRGRQTFETSGCLGCHKREGKGGFVGPEFLGIGDASTHIKYPLQSFDPKSLALLNGNLNLAYIYESVRFPAAQPQKTMMFDFKLSHPVAMDLTVYLKSLAAHQIVTRRLPPEPAYPLSIIKRGSKIFGRFCTACHGKHARGGVKNPNYKNDYIPKLNTLAERMFLYKKDRQDAVIALLDEFGDLLEAGPQPDIPGFFKVVAKYMPVQNIILNGRVVEKKNFKGSTPLNMPAWGASISDKDVSAVFAYLISVY